MEWQSNLRLCRQKKKLCNKKLCNKKLCNKTCNRILDSDIRIKGIWMLMFIWYHFRCHLSVVSCQLVFVICHLDFHLSLDTCHMSLVTCHLSLVTSHFFNFPLFIFHLSCMTQTISHGLWLIALSTLYH